MTALKINKQIIKSLNTDGIINYSAARVVNMTDNPYFPTPVPTKTEIQLLAKLFQEADAKARIIRSVLNTQTRRTAYENLIAGHYAWIEFIENTEGLTLDMILSTGYTPYAERTDATIPPPAPKPNFKVGKNTGEVILIADTYKQGSHRINYNWKMSDDQGATWQNLPTFGNSHRKLVTGLELVKEYWFKVAYATVAGEGEESPHISIVLTSDSRSIKKGQGKKQNTELKKAA